MLTPPVCTIFITTPQFNIDKFQIVHKFFTVYFPSKFSHSHRNFPNSTQNQIFCLCSQKLPPTTLALSWFSIHNSTRKKKSVAINHRKSTAHIIRIENFPFLREFFFHIFLHKQQLCHLKMLQMRGGGGRFCKKKNVNIATLFFSQA
jgi:hypothetical protein